jgi:outer membrane protein assembly factor BamB
MQLTRRCFLIFVLSLMLVPFLDASDWPGFLGPNYNGSAQDETFGKNAGGLVIAWQRSLGSGYSGIAVAGERAVTMFSDGVHDYVTAVETKTGKEIWRYEIGPTYKGHDGSQDGPIATPAIGANRVYGLNPTGKLFALDLATGKSLWSVDAVKVFNSKSPIYGFATSPLVAGTVLIVQTGGDKGRSVAGFDAKSGKLLWNAGDDAISYQSPLLMKIAKKPVVIAVGNSRLYGIDPSTGKILLDYEHGGAGQAEIMVPSLVEEDKLLLRNKPDSSDLVHIVSGADGKLAVEKIWTAGVFKGMYGAPVFHNGFIYGYSSRVLQCVDASNGQIKWRSRTPSDGFPLIVNDALVILTKEGKVHVGQASPDGWKEISKVEPFKKIAWTPPSFGSGAVFTRSHGEIARLDWGTTSVASSTATPAVVAEEKTKFTQFLAEVEKSNDKNAVVDHFWASIKSFPLVEWPDRVYFLYRGAADDMAITGDLTSFGKEEPMHRVAGTDLFYYETRLEPDAKIVYRYNKNYEELIADPNNPHQLLDRRGKPISWMSMPAYKEPSHLKDAPADRKGKIQELAYESKSRKGASIKLDVYLPPNYESSKEESFPVLYVFGGPEVQTQGRFSNSLDNLSGTNNRPVITVFLKEIDLKTQFQDPAEELNTFASVVVKDVIPVIDTHFRTIGEASGRAVMGAGGDGVTALFMAFGYPSLIGGFATQSAFLQDNVLNPLRKMIKDSENPMRIYMDWSLYDFRSTTEAWDNGTENKKFYAYLREKGYRPAGGEFHEGAGWPSWRNRTDRLLAALFPLTE